MKKSRKKSLSKEQKAVMRAECPKCGEGVSWKWSSEEIEITCRMCGRQAFPPDFVDHFDLSPGPNPFRDERVI